MNEVYFQLFADVALNEPFLNNTININLKIGRTKQMAYTNNNRVMFTIEPYKVDEEVVIRWKSIWYLIWKNKNKPIPIPFCPYCVGRKCVMDESIKNFHSWKH